MRPSAEALALAPRWRHALARAVQSGAPGERTGRGTGSSLEFQDRRDYAAGDDVRHLDWRAFARTDQLFVRLYREEILPRVELLVDLSRSMRIDEMKERTTVDLTVLLAGAARSEGLEVRVLGCGDDVLPIEAAALENEGLEFEATRTLADTAAHAHAHLRPGAVRIAVSDFLFPHEAPKLVRTLGRGAGAFALLQVLTRGDIEPPAGSALRLEDSEDASALDLVLDARAVEHYRRRLRGLVAGLQQECRRAGGVFCELSAGGGVERLCRAELATAGVLTPA